MTTTRFDDNTLFKVYRECVKAEIRKALMDAAMPTVHAIIDEAAEAAMKNCNAIVGRSFQNGFNDLIARVEVIKLEGSNT